MRRHIAYLKYVIRHKWYVFLACLRFGLFWRGIKHDWTKFLLSEWMPYARTFYAPDGSGQYKPDPLFDRAWNHHQKANSHHWQYWLLSPDKARPNFWLQSYDGGMSHIFIGNNEGKIAAIVWDAEIEWHKPPYTLESQLGRDLMNTPVPLDMPMVDRKEMLADWMGAGKALGKPKVWEWYEATHRNIYLHPDTRAWIEIELERLETEYERERDLVRGVPGYSGWWT